MSEAHTISTPPDLPDTSGTSFKYDVLIIGAGPAGSSTAGFFLQQNPSLSIGIVDKQRFPRDKACGDGIGPAAVAEVSSLGINTTAWDTAKPLSAAVVHGPDGLSFVTDIRRVASAGTHGLTMRREQFDHALLRHAVELGANLHQEHRFERLEPTDGGLIVVCRNGAGETHFRCRLLVGADGASSRVRRAIGIASQPPTRTGIGIRAYTPFLAGDSTRLYISFDDDLRPGYGWCFPLTNGYANIGVGIVVSDHRKRSVNLHSLLERYQEALRVRGIVTGNIERERTHILPHGGRLPRMTSDRVVLVGDAAAMINPLSGEGIAYGMKAARMLAGTAHSAVADNVGIDRALAQHQRRVRRSLERHMRSNFLAHRLLRSEIWARHVLRSAEHDIKIQRLAVDLMFGDGHLTPRSFWSLLRSNCCTRRSDVSCSD